MRITDTSDLRWKTAVVDYLDVGTYLDGDGDGLDDLTGLAQRIDHLAELGVTCLWLGWGRFEVLAQPHRSVLAHCCQVDDDRLVALHNLGPDPCAVPLDLGSCQPGDRLVDLLQAAPPRCRTTGYGYGYRWLRLLHDGDRRPA